MEQIISLAVKEYMLRDQLGSFEELILLAVGILDENAYGLTILDEVEKYSGRKVMISSIYKTLIRLEKKGYLTSHSSSPSPVRGGRKKRLYQLTSSGKVMLREATEIRNSMIRAIPAQVWKES